MPVEMAVERVVGEPHASHRVVVLRERAGARYLPIAVGAAQAEAIARPLVSGTAQRPLTHDLICELVAALGGRIAHALVHGLRHQSFCACLVIDLGGGRVAVDCRASDAIAVAVRGPAPILVAESVLEQAGGDLELHRQEAGPREAPIRPEQLAAFRDLIDQLDLDDLGGKD